MPQVAPHPCPWCNTIHTGTYILCDEHEALARAITIRNGGTPRE